MSISRILIDLCVIWQKMKIKNIFADIVYNVLVAEKPCKYIKKFAWR